MVVKHLNPKGPKKEKRKGKKTNEGRREEAPSHLVKPIEQLKRGCFALLAWYNETACGRCLHPFNWELEGVGDEEGGWEGGRQRRRDKKWWQRCDCILNRQRRGGIQRVGWKGKYAPYVSFIKHVGWMDEQMELLFGKWSAFSSFHLYFPFERIAVLWPVWRPLPMCCFRRDWTRLSM